jgi:SAM-dependent methyltransferase
MQEVKREVAEIDKIHLQMLRKNVSDFIERSGKTFDKEGLLVLDIAPQDHEGAAPYFPSARVETLDIDPKSGATYIADLCKTNTEVVPADHFDLVVCTEVLEHTLNPFLAVDEICRILKKGGIVLISVPFNFRIHGPLPDCWRISEHGLRSLFSRERGFEIIELIPLEDENRFLMPIHYTLVAKRL